MKNTRLLILGVCAAVVLAIGATASTFAAGTTFSHLDWSKYDLQSYTPYGGVTTAPRTGDGSAITGGNAQTRGWMYVGAAMVAAAGLGTVSYTLIRRRR